MARTQTILQAREVQLLQSPPLRAAHIVDRTSNSTEQVEFHPFGIQPSPLDTSHGPRPFPRPLRPLYKQNSSTGRASGSNSECPWFESRFYVQKTSALLGRGILSPTHPEVPTRRPMVGQLPIKLSFVGSIPTVLERGSALPLGWGISSVGRGPVGTPDRASLIFG